jgi:hypothetical protein
MAADIGFVKPLNKIVCWGKPSFDVEREVETATSMYPGRLVKKGTTDNEVVVATPATAPIVGWLGYDNTPVQHKEVSVDTIYTVNARASVIWGGPFGIVGSLTPNVAVEMGDFLAPWASGELIPVEHCEFGWAIKIPFTKNASQTDTGVDIIAKMLITGATARITTAAGSATIDVGLGNGTEAGFDADGLIDGLSCAATGPGVHVNADSTAGNATVGILLMDQIKDASTPIYATIMEPMVCDGTCISVDYTTSSHTVAGYILVGIKAPGFFPVARALEAVSSSASSQDIMVENLI